MVFLRKGCQELGGEAINRVSANKNIGDIIKMKELSQIL